MKMTSTCKPVVTASALALVLTACGGGGGGGGFVGNSATDTVTGGGSTSSIDQSTTGTIDGFGSIFVNGVRFETDNAEVLIDGETRGEDALSVGMVVTVQGEINDDGVSGTAQRILYDDELTGPVTSIEYSPDDDALLMRVLGFAVIVERNGTRFDDTTFDTLVVDDVVEVSGFIGQGNRLRATRIERKSRFQPGRTEVELKGRVRNLTTSTFTLGELTVDYSNAELDDLDSGVLEDGLFVAVEGTLNGSTITASEVEGEDEPNRGGRFTEGEAVRLHGSVSRYVSNADFRINGTPVDASSAALSPADLTLFNGAVVQINGTWNGNVLVADAVEARRGRIKVEASVDNVDADAGEINLRLFSGTVDVLVNARTRFDDETDQIRRMSLADVRSGDFLEIEAYLSGDRLIATLIDRDDPDDDVIRAPVESFVANSDITLLGITYQIGDAEYEDTDDNTVDADNFFNLLQIGDLVKIEDKEEANGVADEIELEDRLRLEGTREFGCGFEDDSSSCDASIFDDESTDDTSGDDALDESESLDDVSDNESPDDDVTGDDLSEDDIDDAATGDIDGDTTDEDGADDGI